MITDGGSQSDANAMERRLTLQLVAYWEKLRGDRPMPSENDINPEDLAELWDYCFLVQIRDLAKQEFHYTYLGASIVEAYQGALPAGGAGGAVTPEAGRMAESYVRVIQARAPVIEEGEFTGPRGEAVRYRQCMLPLGTGRQVEAIFGGMRFRIFSPEV